MLPEPAQTKLKVEEQSHEELIALISEMAKEISAIKSGECVDVLLANTWQF